MLSAATFKRFKGLADVRVKLGRSTCLVGANASGKTSVLEGIHCLTRLAVRQIGENEDKLGRVGRIFRGRFAPRRLLTAGSNGPIELTLEWPTPHHLRLPLEPSADGSPAPFTPYAAFLEGSAQVVHKPDTAPQFDRQIASTGLGSALRLRLDPARLMEPSYSEEDVPRVGHDGAGLPSVLAYLLGTRDPALAAIEADLERIISGAGRLLTRPARVTRTETEFLRINGETVPRATEHSFSGQRLELVGPHGKGVPADLLSEGTLLVIGLLTVLHTSPDLRLLLLDDIDRGLHPRAQRALVELVLELQRTRPELQVVCTTHSPFVPDLFDPADVRVMRRYAEGHGHCQELTAHPKWPKWESTLKAGEFWSFVGEDWV